MKRDPVLARKIAALTAKDSFDGRALRLGTAGQTDSLTLLLNAVDDTMLQRDAVFAVGASHVTLRVSGKRVQAVLAASDDLAAPADLIDVPLNARAPEAVLQTAQLLERLVRQSGTLTLERRTPASTVTIPDAGVGSQMLARTLAPDEAPAAPPAEQPAGQSQSPIQLLADACAPVADAFITLANGDVETVSGSEDAIEALQTALDTHWDAFEEAHDPFVGDEENTLLRVLTACAPNGQALVVAILGSDQALGLVHANGVGTVAEGWAKAANSAT